MVSTMQSISHMESQTQDFFSAIELLIQSKPFAILDKKRQRVSCKNARCARPRVHQGCAAVWPVGCGRLH